MAEFDAFDTPECYPWGVAQYAQQNQNPGGPPADGEQSLCPPAMDRAMYAIYLEAIRWRPELPTDEGWN